MACNSIKAARFLFNTGMPRIVAIDDDMDLLKMVKSLLLRKGFNVSAFSKWEAAITSIRKHIPQIILLDVFLGNDDGFDVCKKLKADSFTRHIPILVCSGFSKVAETAIFEFGANDFILKPFKGIELLRKIYSVLLKPR